MQEGIPFTITNETIVLKKFNGDDQTQEPVEIITIENGVVVSHEVREPCR